jgi:non-ribosomal peptide synthetase component F
LTVQYADYAWWQRGRLNGTALEDQWAYWKGELVGLPDVLELPADRPRPPARSNRGAVERFELNAKASEKLKEISHGADATLFMTLLAAYGVLLAKYSGQRVIAVGSPVANRHPAEVENLIGLFANTLVLRVDLSGNPLFSELVGRVRETSLGAFAHSDLPFDKLVERLKPVRDLSRTPLFQASFILNNVPRTGFALAGLMSSPVALDTHTSKFDLTLGITEVDDELRGAFEYSTDLFDASTIRRMIKDLVMLLREIPRKLDERVENLLLMDKPDEQPVAPAAEAPETFAGWTLEKDGDSSYVTADRLISEQLQVCAAQLQVMLRQLESLRRADEKPTHSSRPR